MALAVVAVSYALNTGLSAAIVNEVTEESALKNSINYAPEQLHARSLVLASACATLCLVPGTLLLLFIDVRSWFNALDIISARSASLTLFALLFALCVGFFAQVPKSIAIGNRDGFFANIADSASVLVGTFILLLLIWLQWPIEFLAAAFAIVPAFALFAIGFVYLKKKQLASVAFTPFDTKRLRIMGGRTLQMTLHQGLLSINQHSDILIVGILFGPAPAAVYGVAQRLAALINFVTPINHAMWPELISLVANGEGARVRRLFLKLIGFNICVGSFFAAGFFVLANFIIANWLGEHFLVSPGILGGLALWALIYTIVNTLEILLRTLQYFGRLAWLSLIGVPMSVVAKLLVAKLYGFEAVAWVGAASLLLFFALPYLFACVSLLGNGAVGTRNLTETSTSDLGCEK